MRETPVERLEMAVINPRVPTRGDDDHLSATGENSMDYI